HPLPRVHPPRLTASAGRAVRVVRAAVHRAHRRERARARLAGRVAAALADGARALLRAAAASALPDLRAASGLVCERAEPDLPAPQLAARRAAAGVRGCVVVDDDTGAAQTALREPARATRRALLGPAPGCDAAAVPGHDADLGRLRQLLGRGREASRTPRTLQHHVPAAPA